MATGHLWMRPTHFRHRRTVKATTTTHSNSPAPTIRFHYPRTLWVCLKFYESFSFVSSCCCCCVNNLRPCWPPKKLLRIHELLFGLSQNSTLDGSPSIAAFMNFNTSFKQQYPHLLHRQQSQSPISNDPLTSISTQNDFLSLPTIGLLKNEKIPSTDQEKLNDAISQTRRWV